MTSRMLEFQLKLKALLEEYDASISVGLNGAYDLMGCTGMELSIDDNKRGSTETHLLTSASNGSLDIEDFKDNREPCVPDKPGVLYLGQNCRFLSGQCESGEEDIPDYKNLFRPVLEYCNHEYNTCKTEGNCTEDLCPIGRKLINSR